MELFNCRLCSGRLKTVLNLGDLCISGFITDDSIAYEKEPLVLSMCEDCKTAQLKHIVDPDRMYRQYWYKSSLNASMMRDLQDIVDSVLLRYKGKSKVVLDIGANDGSMLGMYPDEFIKVGFDPARNLAKEAGLKSNYFVNDYFSAELYPPVGRAGIVTAIAMFYDLNNPRQFLDGVYQILADDGIFVIQMTDLVSMLKANAFDNLCFPPQTIMLGANRAIKRIHTGDHVIGADGGLQTVSSTMKRDYNGELVNIKAKYLEEIHCTPEHPILVVKKNAVSFNCGQAKKKRDFDTAEWVEAQNVQVGDYLVVPKLKEKRTNITLDLSQFNNIDSPNKRRGLLSLTLNEDIAWLMGLWTAEGFINGRKGTRVVCFTLHEKEVQIINRLKLTVRSLGYKTRIYHSNLSDAVNIQFSCDALADAFTHWFGSGAKNKKIAEFILFSENNIRSAFLRGLFDGDGWIDKNKIELHTSSHVLALQVQLLLFSMGAATGICWTPPRSSTKKDGTIIKSNESWLVRGSSRRLAKIFNYSYSAGKREPKHITETNDYVFVRVSKISVRDYSGCVYNIETENNTYLASNAIVHNCHEHAIYYTLDGLSRLLNTVGFYVFDVETNMVNGGSLRVYVAKVTTGSYRLNTAGGLYQIANNLAVELAQEYDYMGRTTVLDNQFFNFSVRVTGIGLALFKYLLGIVSRGAKIYGLGASTKGNTLLQYYNLDHKVITAIGEVNEDKFGLKTINTLIPIIPEKDVLNARPDILLILPWHFEDFFVGKLWDVMSKGTKLLFPLPEPKLTWVYDGMVYTEKLIDMEKEIPWAI